MATPTISDVIATARRMLQDTKASNYRYPTAEVMLRYANDYLHHMRREAPDLFIGSLAATPDDLAEGAAFPLGWEYVRRAALFVVGLCDLHEEEHAASGRAGAVLTASTRGGR